MDLGGHEGADISLPISSSFMPSMQEATAATAAKVKLVQLAATGGGGGGGGGGSNGPSHMEEMRMGPPSLEILKGKKPVKYRECQKNHAANLGGHAIDGCGEFMPSGEEGTLEALRCAACDCHRNFHRREIEGEMVSCECLYGPARDRKSMGALYGPPHMPLPLPSPSSILQGRQMIMAFNPPAAESDDFDGGLMSPPSSLLKKRFRTKFTQEQKDQMLVFAEKLGWRIQKHDEGAVQQFCAEAGVKRHVLKVWMHNNKNTLGKKTPTSL